jgi:CubicO group peptidase (beta-lactamase class C family)
MLINEGKVDGKQLLSTESVRAFRTIHTGELTTGFTPGNGWGVGCCVVRNPQGASAALSAGSFGHGGAYGTQAWVDPGKRRAYILMTQRANFPNADDSVVRKAFQEKAAKAFDKN